MGRGLRTISEYDRSTIAYPQTQCVLGKASLLLPNLTKQNTHTQKNEAGCQCVGLLL